MKKFSLIISIILINLIFRIWISINVIPTGDIIIHQEWANKLSSQGLSGSYFFQNWTYSPPTQPPLMMMAYSYSGWIYQNRNIFSSLHNLIKFPPAFLLLGFQEYGQILSLRLWEMLTTYLIAIILFFYYQKKSFKKSLLIFLLIIFNPISIFLNSVWGQNDLLPTVFAYIGFIVSFSPFFIFSPAFFLLGVLFKPTIILMAPIFISVFIYRLFTAPIRHKFIKFCLMSVICLLIGYFSFKPFIPDKIKPVGYISSIINNRIKTSSKGLKLASVSSFNLYSLVFNIDQTYATSKNSFIELTDVSNFLIFVLNLFIIINFFKSPQKKFNNSLVIFYLISQGSFLFMANMLERYFIPAFIPSILLMILFWQKYGWLMLFQQILWFLNLIYSYYYRSNGLINHLFRDYNFLLIRLLSLFSLLVYFLVLKIYLKPNASTLLLKSSDK